MQKYLMTAMLATIWTTIVMAQAVTPQRDPNPPYGAAAGAAARANSSPDQSAATSVAGSPTGQTNSAAGSAGIPGANAGTAAANASSGASTNPGTTRGALPERPGAAIASRGSTTATSGNAAPFDPSSTPGWTMMTPQEQQIYSGKISSFTSIAQCRAYHEAYLAQIQARARSMGQIIQSQGSDPCSALQQQGALK
jgi:hypothetical protein